MRLSKRRAPRSVTVAAAVALGMLFAAGPACASGATPPSIEGQAASDITATDATLEAQIDSGGLETTYEVMLEAPSCQSVNPPGSCEASGGIAIATGSIPAAASPQQVSIDVAQAWQSLSPNTAYAYFFRAINSEGEADGHQREFMTLGGASKPIQILAESASNVTATDATLEAQIDPGDTVRGAYYQFQLAPDFGEYPAEIFCPTEESATIPLCVGPHSESALPIGFVSAGSEPLTVGIDLASAGVVLEPGTTYHYRALAAAAVPSEDTAEWEAPIMVGADQAFTTPEASTGEAPGASGGSEGQQSTGMSPPQATVAIPHRRGGHRHRQHRHWRWTAVRMAKIAR